MAKRFGSHGKLLLSGEYGVLNGALALAVPVKYSQWFDVAENDSIGAAVLSWEAKNNGKPWFNAKFEKNSLKILETNNKYIAEKLKELLGTARKLNSKFLSENASCMVQTNTDFDMAWGLGSSSTLIVNVSRWSGVDLYELFFKVSEGSGYDVACTSAATPVLYKKEGHKPYVEKVSFYPGFHACIYFVYLGLKQDTEINVRRFLSEKKCSPGQIEKISLITQKMVTAKSLEAFIEAIDEHEQLISGLINVQPVKHQFPDFKGTLKSLGAWGGDFMMVASKCTDKQIREYFNNKGLRTVIPFNEMIL
ncbi:MAG: GYDIA family GHMP kinase [Bacteroidales bacterium]